MLYRLQLWLSVFCPCCWWTCILRHAVGYARSRQLLDLAPVYILAAAAAAAAWAVFFIGLSGFILLVVQAVVFLLVYAGGARLFRLAGAADLACIAEKLAFRKRT